MAVPSNVEIVPFGAYGQNRVEGVVVRDDGISAEPVGTVFSIEISQETPEVQLAGGIEQLVGVPAVSFDDQNAPRRPRERSAPQNVAPAPVKRAAKKAGFV